MKYIHEMIDAKKIFIGRQDELSTMQRQLKEHIKNWRMLHFHGTSGMGKTVLLKEFAQINFHHPSIYIAGKQTFHSVDLFLSHVENALFKNHHISDASEISDVSDVTHNRSNCSVSVVERIIRLTEQHEHFIILFDDFEPSLTLLRWLTHEFIAKLPVNVHIFSAARLPLDSLNVEYGWETIVNNIELKPFSQLELHQFANAFEIYDERLILQLETISQGIPLAAMLACNWFIENRINKPIKKLDLRNLIEVFDRHLLDVSKLSGMNKTLLALASLTFTFDQEMLAHMLGKPIPIEEFEMLCQSPFVEPRMNGGWMVASGVRKWARILFKERLPDTYEQYRKRAEEILDRRLALRQTHDPSLNLDYIIGKYMLQEIEYVQQVIYTKRRHQLTIRPVRQDEFPMLIELYRKNNQNSPPYKVDDSHQEQYLEAIWNIDPSAIQLMENDAERKYFFVRVPLNKAFQSLLRKNPMTQKWIHSSDHHQEDLFYWFNTSRPPLDWDTIDYFLKVFINDLKGRKVTCLLWSEDQAKFLQLLGFEHIQNADYTTPKGLQYFFYSLDSRNLQAKKVASVLKTDKLDMEEHWVQLTKKLLDDYRNIHRHLPLIRQFNPWSLALLNDHDLVERFQTIVEQFWKLLQKGNKQEQLQAKIMQHAYLKERLSHEIVAELLDIPTSTYYRHLKKLVVHLSRHLKQAL